MAILNIYAFESLECIVGKGLILKNIFVSCCVMNNLGDDLFLLSLLKRYSSRSDLKFHIVCDESYKVWEKSYPNLVCHTYQAGDIDDSMLRKLRANIHELCMLHSMGAKGFDATVQITGSIFIEPQMNNKLKQYYLRWRALKALKYIYQSSDNVFVMGSNFGPWYTNRYIEVLREYYSRYCKDVCFRDQKSADLFHGLVNVRYAPDILFGYPMKKCMHGKNVFISVVDLSRKGQESLQSAEQYESWLMKEIRRADDRGYTVTLCSFCDQEGDSAVVNRLAEAAAEAGIIPELMFYHKNPDVVLDRISSSEYVIASRFHAAILSLSAGCRVLPVMYSQKTRNVLDDLGYPIARCVDLTSNDSSVFEHDVFDATYFGLKDVKERAGNQFLVFDRWVRDSGSVE